jgi:hypothetical protein
MQQREGSNEKIQVGEKNLENMMSANDSKQDIKGSPGKFNSQPT